MVYFDYYLVDFSPMLVLFFPRAIFVPFSSLNLSERRFAARVTVEAKFQEMEDERVRGVRAERRRPRVQPGGREHQGFRHRECGPAEFDLRAEQSRHFKPNLDFFSFSRISAGRATSAGATTPAPRCPPPSPTWRGISTHDVHKCVCKFVTPLFALRLKGYGQVW